jgi:hypothetical protein
MHKTRPSNDDLNELVFPPMSSLQGYPERRGSLSPKSAPLRMSTKRPEGQGSMTAHPQLHTAAFSPLPQDQRQDSHGVGTQKPKGRAKGKAAA